MSLDQWCMNRTSIKYWTRRSARKRPLREQSSGQKFKPIGGWLLGLSSS